MTFLFRLTYAFPLLSFAVVSQEEQSKRSRPRMGAYNLVDVVYDDVLTFALVPDKVGKILRVLDAIAVRNVDQLIFLVVGFFHVFVEKGFYRGFTSDDFALWYKTT